MLLEIRGLSKYFGGLAAISQLDMHIKMGEIVGIIGPNGSGKTTLFNLITGIHRPTTGRITYEGKDITGKKPHLIAELGIARTFQLNPLLADFTVLENVRASFHLHPRSSLWDAFFNTRTYRRNEKYVADESLEILKLVRLDKVKDDLAKNLPYGYQKMLGIARALATKPKLLLLDEPIGGMSSDEIDFTMVAIRKMHQQNMTIVLVEHNMQIMELCNRVVVINFGCKIAEGSIEEVSNKNEVIQAYFGVEHAA
jgi:branched-chain amino acid transport system ATP-binding protein